MFHLELKPCSVPPTHGRGEKKKKTEEENDSLRAL
jgi:hypothetical protein